MLMTLVKDGKDQSHIDHAPSHLFHSVAFLLFLEDKNLPINSLLKTCTAYQKVIFLSTNETFKIMI